MAHKRKRTKEVMSKIRDPMWNWAPDPCRVYVEIGALAGSTCFRAIHQLPKALVFGVDLWADYHGRPEYYGDPEEGHRKFLDLLAPWLGKRAWAVRGDSVAMARTFPHKVDMLFIDGDHSFEGCLADLRAWWPKCNNGALIVGDDYQLKTVQRAIEAFGKRYWTGYALFKKKHKQFWLWKGGHPR